MKILIINGPNLNLLGKREESHYGNLTLADIEDKVKTEFPSEYFEFFQSNIEGEIVDNIQKAHEFFHAIVINPGGYAHTSVAIRDAMEICSIPIIEVHLSNLSQRDDFRQTMITAPKSDGYLSGFKEHGYLAAIYLIKKTSEI